MGWGCLLLPLPPPERNPWLWLPPVLPECQRPSSWCPGRSVVVSAEPPGWTAVSTGPPRWSVVASAEPPGWTAVSTGPPRWAAAGSPRWFSGPPALPCVALPAAAEPAWQPHISLLACPLWIVRTFWTLGSVNLMWWLSWISPGPWLGWGRFSWKSWKSACITLRNHNEVLVLCMPIWGLALVFWLISQSFLQSPLLLCLWNAPLLVLLFCILLNWNNWVKQLEWQSTTETSQKS